MNKKHFKIELLLRELTKGKLKSTMFLFFRIVKTLFCGSRRIAFAIKPSDIKNLTGFNSVNYEVKMISSWDAAGEDLKNELRLHRAEIQADVESMLGGGACLWAGYWK